MKTSHWCLILLAVLVLGVPIGCGPASVSGTDSSLGAPLIKGIIMSASWETGGGKTEGITRRGNAVQVPGGSGSWNVDAYGKLYSGFLVVVVNPQNKDATQQVIPIQRLVSVEFGDGGIKTVNPKP